MTALQSQSYTIPLECDITEQILAFAMLSQEREYERTQEQHLGTTKQALT